MATAPDDVDPLKELDAEAQEFERRQEISRILTALKVDPYHVLNIKYSATPEQISKQYRTISLKVHPDKVPAALREDAQKAFSKLAQAKQELEDEDKQTDVLRVVAEVRQRLIETRIKLAKKAEKEAKKATRSSTPPAAPYDPTTEPDFDNDLAKEVRETLIDREWRKRQMLRQASEIEGAAAKEAEMKKRQREEEEKHEKQWEETRELRVGSWRDFMSKNKAAKKPRPPKIKAEDSDKTYVRRVANS
eukprot:TRINITY_DN8027_c0_g5_i1.p1 TRINITY_DN8027_c0_g5~~TRINITY_DN8027_c0_g5_i1.p1  ORF type:complete len:248 (-),score=74.46 TRINITY_DN8027_c0_g5_i1:51-794(-)